MSDMSERETGIFVKRVVMAWSEHRIQKQTRGPADQAGDGRRHEAHCQPVELKVISLSLFIIYPDPKM